MMSPISLPAGASICVDFAYVYGRGNSNLNSITIMRERVDAVRNWYQNQSIGCSGQFTSVSPEPQALNARVYPNPFQNEFKLQLEQPLQTAGTVHVLDVLGKEVFKETWMAGQQEAMMQLELPSGMYFVQLRSANKQFSARLIKQ